MGNCQAIDNASLVIQHPCGKVDRLYSPVPASQVMKLNPGHYVALLLTTTVTGSGENHGKSTTSTTTTANNNKVRITRIKLLRATDTLALGHAYRLITTQEVMKGLCAKKYAKMKKIEPHHQQMIKEKLASDFGSTTTSTGSELETKNQVSKNQSNHRSGSATSKSRGNGGGGWHPKLQSISEATGS